MISHNDFFSVGFGRVWQEVPSGIETQNKRLETASLPKESPFEEAQRSLRNLNAARTEVLSSDPDFSDENIKVIEDAGKPLPGSVTEVKMHETDVASQKYQEKYEEQNIAAESSLKGVCDKYDCTIQIHPKYQDSQHQETTVAEQNLFTQIGQELVGDYQTKTTTDTTNDTDTKEELVVEVTPRGGLPYRVDLGVSTDDLGEMGADAEPYVAHFLGDQLRDHEKNFAFLKDRIEPNPSFSPATDKTPPPQAPIFPSLTSERAAIVPSRSASEVRQTTSEVPQNSSSSVTNV